MAISLGGLGALGLGAYAWLRSPAAGLRVTAEAPAAPSDGDAARASEEPPAAAVPMARRKWPPEEFAKLDWTGTLRKHLGPATRLRVRSGGLCHRRVEEEGTLFETHDRATIRSFIQAIDIDAATSGHSCLCCGNPTFELHAGEALLAEIGFHHGHALRWRSWPGDGTLTNESSTRLLDWLAKRGVGGPKHEVEEDRRRRDAARSTRERWERAMPSAAWAAWTASRGKIGWGVVAIPLDPTSFDPAPLGSNAAIRPRGPEGADALVDEMEKALAEAVPDTPTRIRALFSWYGAGEGPWSAFPSYETVPETLLLRYAVDDVVAAADTPSLTTAETEGAARFFAGWGFQVYRAGGGARLTPGLKKRLLDHALLSGDPDKHQRAHRAFDG